MVVSVFLVSGILVGLIWPHLVPDVEMVMTQVGPYPVTEADAGELMSMDAWYALLGGGAALLVGAVLGASYIRFGVVTVLALLAGACVAAVAALAVGSLSAGGEVLLAWEPKVPERTELTAPLMLHAYGVMLVWPVAALAPMIPLAWLGWEHDGNPERTRPVPFDKTEGQ